MSRFVDFHNPDTAIRIWEIAMDNDIMIVKLKEATDGLMFQSESDYPVEPFFIDGTGITELTGEDILIVGNYSPDTPVNLVEFERFFRVATREQSWHREQEKEAVKRFQALVALLKENLADIRVFKVGKVEMDVYVMGKLSGDFLGIKTKIVET